MISAISLVIALLKASPPVGALVSDRIEPEIAKGGPLPRIVVRQASGRCTYGLARASGLRDAQVTILCVAATFTAADRLASAVIAALENVTSVPVLGSRITVRQEGDDTGTAEPDGLAFTRIIGFRERVSA